MAGKEIERMRFGRSGHLSSRTIFGAAALKNASESQASRALDILLEYGVNHIDVAPRYGDAELRVGAWMKAHRDRFFLATKTGLRSYQDSKDEIRRSLDRLKVDAVDLLQLHSLAHPGDWERAMGEGGALEAVIEAKEEGLTRFVGVTGHGWTIAAMHLKSLDRFDFDSVLMPWNFVMYQNERYRGDFDALCRRCAMQDVAVQTIKSIALGPWGTTTENRNTWYQPLEDAKDIETAVHWALGRPGIFLNTVGDLDLLTLVLDAAARFEESPGDEAMRKVAQDRRATSLFGIGT
ncbi:MAG: aldo/keto reductase [Ectothiorhodospiraceae bacterium AqS1]|nr:aldo/keto reductase [Ectothiorhodospiraceae bacterium AqS1]